MKPALVFQLYVCISTFILSSISTTDAKVVALLSVPHTANVRTHTNVGRALTKLGHEAYVLIPRFMLDNKMVNTDGINVISYGEYLGNVEEAFTERILLNIWKSGQTDISDLIHLLSYVKDIVPQILADTSLIAKLQKIRPNLILLTYVPPFKNMVILPYMLNSSFAYLSPYYDLLGNRVPFSLTATPCQGFPFDSNAFISRLKNVMCHTVLITLEYLLANDTMVQEFAPDRPSISVNELAKKSEIYLLESDHIMDFTRPLLPNMKLIGCTAATSERPLKDPFKTFVESSKNGIAVVTFGSSVVNIPEEIARKMAAAFELQDLNVVWRVNYTSSNPKKILTSEWIPQNDILAHANTRLFVSHCGANGQYETLYHGVPILCLPLFGDQFYNARRITTKGFGLDAKILEVSGKQLADLMKEVAGNDKYRNNIKKASTVFKLLYKEPAESAAFWIDHVMEYGGSYMRSAGQDMPLYQLLGVDVLGFLFLVLVIICFIFYLVYRCFCVLCCKCCRKRKFDKRIKSD